MSNPVFEKRNVLIIGGAGFFGSHLARELVKDSKVVIIDNLSSGDIFNIEELIPHPNCIFIRADASELLDLAQYPELDRFQVKFQGFQEIYNFACPTTKIDFEKNIPLTLKANSSLVLQSLEWAKKYKAKYFFASSSVVYGSPLPGQPPVEESYWGFVDHLSPRSAYNEGKRFAETLVWNYGKQYGIEIKIARIFSLYGPGMKLNVGRIIPDFVLAVLDKKDLVIYGDGNEINSYCYITDAVDAVKRFMDSSYQGVLNIGSTESIKLYELAEQVIALLKSPVKIVFQEPLSYLIKPSLPDIRKAKEEIGWFPLIHLQAGLQKTIDSLLASRFLKR